MGLGIRQARLLIQLGEADLIARVADMEQKVAMLTALVLGPPGALEAGAKMLANHKMIVELADQLAPNDGGYVPRPNSVLEGARLEDPKPDLINPDPDPNPEAEKIAAIRRKVDLQAGSKPDPNPEGKLPLTVGSEIVDPRAAFRRGEVVLAKKFGHWCLVDSTGKKVWPTNGWMTKEQAAQFTEDAGPSHVSSDELEAAAAAL